MSVLAIDLGSSSIKGLSVSDAGAILAFRQIPMAMSYQPGGLVELEAEAACQKVVELMAGLNRECPGDPVTGLCFSCLGTAAIPVDREGRILANGISPLDARFADPMSVYEPLGLDPARIYQETGQNPRVTSLLHHFLWMKKERPEILRTTHKLVSLKALLVARLTGEYAEDFSWASRTMLMDLQAKVWSAAILSAIGLNPDILPRLGKATEALELCPDAARRLGMKAGVAMTLGGLDNCCAYAGAANSREDTLVNLVGTYEHLLSTPAEFSFGEHILRHEIFAFRYVDPDRVLTCSRAPTGHRINELARRFNLSPERLTALFDQLADGPPSLQRRPSSADQQPQDHLQDVLTKAAFALKDYLQANEAWPQKKNSAMIVAGGGSSTARALQLKANILGRSLAILKQPECGCWGAARLALAAGGRCSWAEAQRQLENPPVRVIEPDPAKTQAFTEWRVGRAE